MVKPSFIPPADIRELRDLVRYHFKLTCMIIGEKNRAHNCLTVSNLKLDDVFSDIFGKSSRSITEQILQHLGKYLMCHLLWMADVCYKSYIFILTFAILHLIVSNTTLFYSKL